MKKDFVVPYTFPLHPFISTKQTLNNRVLLNSPSNVKPIFARCFNLGRRFLFAPGYAVQQMDPLFKNVHLLVSSVSQKIMYRVSLPVSKSRIYGTLHKVYKSSIMHLHN
jgi:hypothetical protein